MYIFESFKVQVVYGLYRLTCILSDGVLSKKSPCGLLRSCGPVQPCAVKKCVY